MIIKNKSLAINSSLILVITTLIGTISHEFAHFISAKCLDIPAELHHNYVSFNTDNVSDLHQAIIAGAGPTFSLIFGFLILYLSIKIKKANLLKLFLLWLGMNGILMFLGYLLIAPFAKLGDTGLVFKYLGISNFYIISIAIISFIVILKLFKFLAKQFRFYKSSETFNQKETAKQLFVIPIVGSITFVTVISFPIPIWISLLPTVFMPLTYISTLKRYEKLNIENPQYYSPRISRSLIFMFIAVLGIFIFLK